MSCFENNKATLYDISVMQLGHSLNISLSTTTKSRPGCELNWFNCAEEKSIEYRIFQFHNLMTLFLKDCQKVGIIDEEEGGEGAINGDRERQRERFSDH